jgi:MFS family permease
MVLSGAIFQPSVGRLSDTIGRKPVFVAGAAAGAVACIAAALSTSLLVAVPALIVAVAAFYGIRSSVLASVVDFGGQREATTLGLAFMLLDGVGALGAAMAGAVGSLDLHYAFLLAACLAALGGLRGEARGVDGDARVRHPREALELVGLIPDDVEILADLVHPGAAGAAAATVFEGREIGRRDVERLGHLLQRHAVCRAQFAHPAAERGHPCGPGFGRLRRSST